MCDMRCAASELDKARQAADAGSDVPNMEVPDGFHVLVELVDKRHSGGDLNTFHLLIGDII